uniref:Uncharacterized protein n=1 Tax=Rhodnius prolixus TaxID=13249 RepID=T1I4Z9_RHOPR
MYSLITTSWIFDIIIMVTPLILFLFYKMKKNYDYFKDRGMPYYETGYKNVVNWKVLFLKETIEDSIDKVYTKMAGYKYAGLPGVFGKPSILLLDPEIIEKILIKDFSYFQDRINSNFDSKVNPLQENLFNLKGQMWKTLRSKLSPTFTSGKLKWMFSQISSCTDVLLEYLNEKATGEDFLIRDIISCYGFDIIASCAFGLEAQAQKNPDNEFRKKASRIFKPSVLLMIRHTVSFLFPKLAKILKLNLIDPEISEFFCTLTKETLNQRKESGITRNDFLQLLLQLKEKGYVEYEANEASEVENGDSTNEKIEFTDEFLAAQLFTFFLAGFESVTSLIVYTLYVLSKELEVQSKVRDEVMKAKEKYGPITYDSLKEMTYLETVMAETLRLHPPARLMIRTCTKTYTLDDGNQIEKDTIIIIPNYSIQRDQKYFPDPEEFKPERFADGEQLSIRQGRGIYLPFGDGPRVCIARRFALLEAKMALAKVVENFQINASSKNIEPLKCDPKAFITNPIGGLWLKMEKIL